MVVDFRVPPAVDAAHPAVQWRQQALLDGAPDSAVRSRLALVNTQALAKTIPNLRASSALVAAGVAPALEAPLTDLADGFPGHAAVSSSPKIRAMSGRSSATVTCPSTATLTAAQCSGGMGRSLIQAQI